jgi:hypothetical protein
MQLMRAPRPLWATFAIACLLNMVLGLLAYAAIGNASPAGLSVVHVYAFVFFTTLLLYTTNFADKRWALAAGTVYLFTILASDVAICFTTQNGMYPIEGRLIVAVWVGVAYAIASIIGVGAIWTFFPKSSLGVIAIIAIPVTVAILFVIFAIGANVSCATMRDCL